MRKHINIKYSSKKQSKRRSGSIALDQEGNQASNQVSNQASNQVSNQASNQAIKHVQQPKTPLGAKHNFCSYFVFNCTLEYKQMQIAFVFKY